MTEMLADTSTESDIENKYLHKFLLVREQLNRVHNGTKATPLIKILDSIQLIEKDDVSLDNEDWVFTFSEQGISVIPMPKKLISNLSISKIPDGCFQIGPLKQNNCAARSVPTRFMKSDLITFLKSNGYQDTKKIKERILVNLSEGSGNLWYVNVSIRNN